MSRHARTLSLAALVALAAAGSASAQTFGIQPALQAPQQAQAAVSAAGLQLAPNVTLEVVRLRKLADKGVTQLEFTVSNRSDLPTTLRDLGLANNFWLEGFKLVDFANSRRYAMGVSEGTCLCSTVAGVDGGVVKAGETKTFWAWFAMPAGDVREMSVLVPDRAPILNVQLQ